MLTHNMRSQMRDRYPPQPYQQQDNVQQQYPQMQNHQMNGGGYNHLQGQNHGPNSIDGQSNSASGGPGGSAPEMSLAGVLHYLQSEWRRWERDRNEWEIERAEMRARIAFLEGQRKSAENLKVDLLRRVKMLEFALRQERSKAGTTGKASAIPPSRFTALKDDEKSNKDEKEASPSEGGSEDSNDRPRANGVSQHAGSSKLSVSSRQENNPWKNTGGFPRDPKARARSRDYLKQCLQEVSYLTSPGALNPLPPRPPIKIESDLSVDPLSQNEHSQRPTIPEPPRKELPPEDLSRDSMQSRYADPSSQETSQQGSTSSESKPLEIENKMFRPNGISPSTAMALEDTAKPQPPSSPAVKTMPLPESNGPVISTNTDHGPVMGEDDQLLTAIYKPGSKAAWRETLQNANDEADSIRSGSSKAPSEQSDEDRLANLTLTVDDEETKTSSSVNDHSEHWTAVRTLKSHLDIVRAVAFIPLETKPNLGHGHGQDTTIRLVSGGDDNVVKVWSLSRNAMTTQKIQDPEPIITFRGHTSPITSIAVSTKSNMIFSASMDSTIRLWRIPPSDHDPYSSYDPSLTLQTLEGHTDAIWDLCLVEVKGKEVLVSASSDGHIKGWSRDQVSPSKSTGDGDLPNGDVHHRWSVLWDLAVDEGDGVVPTCLHFSENSGDVLVGLSNGTIKVLEQDSTSSGDFKWREGRYGTPGSSQVNSIADFSPAMPFIVSGHEDGVLNIWQKDSPSETPLHTVRAHPAAITSISISPQKPDHLFTASVDCTVRSWDLNTRESTEELSGHRKRSDEGVCAISGHSQLPILASAGADGSVRLWMPSTL